MEEEKKVFELHPLSKWKRILLSLGDYFIAFILSFALFNLVVFPLAKVICKTQDKNYQAEKFEEKANKLLIDYGIIFESAGDTFEEHVDYTFKVFLSYYCFDSENPVEAYPQYGHKIENEVIRTYYIDIKDNEALYLSYFNEHNVDGMFEIGDTASSVALKAEYKELLSAELLEVTDESKYSKSMTNFRDHVFARLFYLDVYKDIQKNDFVRDGVSYNKCLEQVKKIMLSLQWVVTASALITIVLSWSIVYLIYPLINSSHRTMTMSIMKLDKLKIGNMDYINRKNVLLQSFYYFLLALSPIIILPVLYFGCAYTFNLPLLFVLSALSLGLAIVSLFFILFNQYNRSGSDLLTYTVVVPTSELDNLYLEQHNNG